MTIKSIVILTWATILICIGIYVLNRLTDTTNPNSFISVTKKLRETIDDDSKVP